MKVGLFGLMSWLGPDQTDYFDPTGHTSELLQHADSVYEHI